MRNLKRYMPLPPQRAIFSSSASGKSDSRAQYQESQNPNPNHGSETSSGTGTEMHVSALLRKSTPDEREPEKAAVCPRTSPLFVGVYS